MFRAPYVRFGAPFRYHAYFSQRPYLSEQYLILIGLFFESNLDFMIKAINAPVFQPNISLPIQQA